MSKKSPSDLDKHIGACIKLQRSVIGMSQERLGDILGITFQQIQKYEKGINRIGAGRLQSIASALGVPVSFFFEDATGSSDLSAEASAIHAFLTSREGVEFAQAFLKIESPAMRRALIDMARAAAAP